MSPERDEKLVKGVNKGVRGAEKIRKSPEMRDWPIVAAKMVVAAMFFQFVYQGGKMNGNQVVKGPVCFFFF